MGRRKRLLPVRGVDIGSRVPLADQSADPVGVI